MSLELTETTFPVDPSPDVQPFWNAVQHGELILPWCESCEAAFWYPRPLCPRCGSREVTWRAASGRGHVYSFCVHHTRPAPHLTDLVPFATVLVDLEEGPRMLGLFDGDPRIGIEVAMQARPTATDLRVPVFVAAEPRVRDPST